MDVSFFLSVFVVDLFPFQSFLISVSTLAVLLSLPTNFF